MKKLIGTLIVIFLVFGSLSACSQSEKTEVNKQSHKNEVSDSIKKTAKHYDYFRVKNGGIKKGTKIIAEGTVTYADKVNDDDIVAKNTTFTLSKNSNGSEVYWVKNKSNKKIKLNDHVKVYGIYTGKDKNTDLPTIDGIVVENDSNGKLNKVGDSKYTEGFGKETIIKQVKFNKIVKQGPIQIILHNANIITVTDIDPYSKSSIEQTINHEFDKEFTYFELNYDVKNTANVMYAWDGYNTAIVDGEQLDIRDVNFYPPNTNEIQPGATVKENKIAFVVDKKDIKDVKLIPEDVLKENTFTGTDQDIKGEPLMIHFK